MTKFYCHCRFCKKYETDSVKVVKYAARHYAHFKCYLAHGKKIERLSAWQVGRFPARLLKERGLMEIALAIVNGPNAEKLWEQKLEFLTNGDT